MNLPDRGCYFLKHGRDGKGPQDHYYQRRAQRQDRRPEALTPSPQLAGVDVPENTKILIGEVESVDISEEFAHEKLSPVLAMYQAKDL